MKVLIACEESQRVCIAFRKLSHEAYSCDIQEPSGGHPEWHILGDALEAIKGGVITTADGKTHNVGRNPVGFLNTAYRKPDQIIHPYMFASSQNDTENYVTKATCLWLKNLPKLRGNGLPKPNNAEIYGVMPSGKVRTWEDTYSRSGKVRSKTFPGIAEAMAKQWGGDIR